MGMQNVSGTPRPEMNRRERGMAASQSGFMLFYNNAEPEVADRIAVGDLRGTNFGSYAAARSGVLFGAEVPSETPLFHDVFNVGKKSPHMIITGAENTGKTALARTLLRRHALKGDRVFAIGQADALANEDDQIFQFGKNYSINPFVLIPPVTSGDSIQDKYAASSTYRTKKKFLMGFMDLLAARYAMELPVGNVYEDVLSALIDNTYQYKTLNVIPGREDPSKWEPMLMPTFADFAQVVEEYEKIVSNYDTRERLTSWSSKHLTSSGALQNKNSRTDRITFAYYRQTVACGKALWGREELYALHIINRVVQTAHADPELNAAFKLPSRRAEFGAEPCVIDVDNPLYAYLVLEDIVGHVVSSDFQQDSILFFDDVLMSPSPAVTDYIVALWKESSDEVSRISIWVSACGMHDEIAKLEWLTGTRIIMGDIGGKAAKDFGVLKTPSGAYQFYALTSVAEDNSPRRIGKRITENAGCSLSVVDDAAFGRYCHELGLGDEDSGRLKKMIVIALIALQQQTDTDYDDIVKFWNDRTWRNIVCSELRGANAEKIRKMSDLSVRNSDVSSLRSRSTKARVLAKRGYSIDSLYKQETRNRTDTAISLREMKQASEAYVRMNVTLDDVMIEQHGADAIRRFFINVVPSEKTDGMLPMLCLAGPDELLDVKSLIAPAIANEYATSHNVTVKTLSLARAGYSAMSRTPEQNPVAMAISELKDNERLLVFAELPEQMGEAAAFDKVVEGLLNRASGSKGAVVFLTSAPERGSRDVIDMFHVMTVPVVPYDLSKPSERKRATLSFIASMTVTCGLNPMDITPGTAEMVPLLPMYTPADIRKMVSVAYADCLNDLGADGLLSYENILKRIAIIADDMVVYVDSTKAAVRRALEHATLESSKPGDNKRETSEYIEYSAIELIGDLLNA